MITLLTTVVYIWLTILTMSNKNSNLHEQENGLVHAWYYFGEATLALVAIRVVWLTESALAYSGLCSVATNLSLQTLRFLGVGTYHYTAAGNKFDEQLPAHKKGAWWCL